MPLADIVENEEDVNFYGAEQYIIFCRPQLLLSNETIIETIIEV